MQTEFPGNSHRDKATHPPRTEQKRIEQVVTSGEVVRRRKKPLGKRFTEIFFGGDTGSVWEYVAFDVLIPAAKDMIADAFTQGIERLIFPDAHSHGRRSSRRPGDSHINYQSRYSRSGRREEPRYSISRRGRANHDFDEIILPSRAEAEMVIDQLFELTDKFNVATVADLYTMVGITENYTDRKWGWEDLRGANVTRLRGGGYLLDLPRPEPLD